MTTPSRIRVGRRYRANRLDGPYDAIVIGSGIGGLTAACLSKLGRKVAVFEQHYTAGGFTHSYERNGYEWDIEAPVVISNAGVYNTFETLLPEDAPYLDDYRRKLQNVERSMASNCLYIGLADTAANLGLPKTNYWIYPGPDYERHIQEFMADPENNEIPLVYISFPSAKDPTFSERYPGRATIEIVAPGPYEWYADWADKPWGKRGDDYEARKEAYARRLLEKLYEKFPQLVGKVDYYELSTPLSTDYFCRYRRGEIYGLNHTPERFGQDWLKPKTRIPGLYLTGQDIMTCGVVGAMIGGLLTTLAISGLRGLPLARRMFME